VVAQQGRACREDRPAAVGLPSGKVRLAGS
jgi:hypothetical protein